jgi:hypothetical protein
VILNTHIFKSKKVNSISKLLATIKHVLMIMNKNYYHKKLSGTRVYCSYNNTEDSFEIESVDKLKNISLDIKDTILESLNIIENKKIYKNKNKKLVFVVDEEEIFYIGMFYHIDNKYNLYDISFNHIKKIASLSKKIKINERIKLKCYYNKVYDDFIKYIKDKELLIETLTGKQTLKIKDLLVDNKINLDKKIVYKNKKYNYNSIKLYTMIIENSGLISNYKLDLIKYDIISIYICKELCAFLNDLNKEVSDYSIYDIENKINYKIVNKFNFDYNKTKEIELLPPLLPLRI